MSLMNRRSVRRVMFLASLIVIANGNSLAQGQQLLMDVSPTPSALSEDDKQEWISAIGNDRTDQLADLVSDFDPSLLLSLTAPNGKSALMVASKKGDLSLAARLVSASADIHETTNTSGTAFMFAVLGNNQDIAHWLVEQGADIHVVGSNGWTALTIAAAKGNVELLQWLIDLGADAQIRDVYRFTPLLRAVDNGYLNAAALLLNLPDTDINARDEYDNTALHHAVSAQNTDMITLLIEHNADVHVKNRDGVSSLELSKEFSSLEALLNSEPLE